MAYTITNLKTDLQGMLHGTSLSKVQGVNALIQRAGRDLVADADLRELKRTVQIENALFDDVFNYAAPSDLKGEKIIDIRPQINRGENDNPSLTGNKELDHKKNNQSFTVESNSGTKFVRIVKDLTPGLLLNECDSLTENGTWAADGVNATNLAIDSSYKATGSASLKFDIATGGYIENSTMTAVDLTDHLNNSSIFVWVYFPDASVITNVILRWGSSNSSYYSDTVTSAHYGAFQTGWNLLRFDWNGASTTGSPSVAAIDYLRLTFTTTGSDSDIRVDSIYSKLPSIYEMVYYSRFLFKTAAGVWKETVDNDDDIVNLETDAYNLLLNKVMELAAPQIQDRAGSFDAAFYQTEYKTGLKNYTSSNKSEAIKKRIFYY